MANIIKRRQVQQKIGLSYNAIYERLNPKSPRYDPDFPKAVKLGTAPNSPLGWIEAEVDAWIAKRFEKTNAVREV